MRTRTIEICWTRSPHSSWAGCLAFYSYQWKAWRHRCLYLRHGRTPIESATPHAADQRRPETFPNGMASDIDPDNIHMQVHFSLGYLRCICMISQFNQHTLPSHVETSLVVAPEKDLVQPRHFHVKKVDQRFHGVRSGQTVRGPG